MYSKHSKHSMHSTARDSKVASRQHDLLANRETCVGQLSVSVRMNGRNRGMACGEAGALQLTHLDDLAPREGRAHEGRLEGCLVVGEQQADLRQWK